MVSSSITPGGLAPGQLIHFDSLNFTANDSALHPDAPLTKITLPMSGSLHFCINDSSVFCLQDPIPFQLARQVPPRCLRCSSKPPLGNPATRLVGMVNSDSLYPLLESCSNVEECSSRLASVAEVFAANTSSPHDNNTVPEAGVRHDATIGPDGIVNDGGAVALVTKARANK